MSVGPGVVCVRDLVWLGQELLSFSERVRGGGLGRLRYGFESNFNDKLSRETEETQ